jgi:DNA-binding IscR family transcriptional regulator
LIRAIPLRCRCGEAATVLSGTAEYALRAVVCLARQPDGQPMRASDLAEQTRGKKGGFKLAVQPGNLTLLRVVSLFDSIAVGPDRRCLMGRPECDGADPCPVHHRWKDASEAISTFFEETTVGDVLSDERRGGRPT